MTEMTRRAFDMFDEVFEDVLAELKDLGVTKAEVEEYFGPTHLMWYIQQRLAEG